MSDPDLVDELRAIVCPENAGCNPLVPLCQCELQREAAEEITHLRETNARLRASEAELVEALRGIEELCNDEIKKRFSSSYTSEADMAKGSRIYPLLSLPRNLARAALADQTGETL